MTASIDWAGSPLKEITVPLADLTFDRTDPLTGRSIYKHDINLFHQELRTLEAGEDEGRPWPTTHLHNTTVDIDGADFARTIVFISPYVITYEDGNYAVEFEGANTNLATVTTVNSVQVRPGNSAGLIGQGDIASIKTSIENLASFIEGGREIDFTGSDVAGWQRVERDVAGTEIRRYNLHDQTNVRINESVSSFLARTGMISYEVLV